MEQKFIDLHTFIKNDDRRLVALKTLLIRFMSDKGYFFDVKKYMASFFDSYTFDHILSVWAGRPVHMYEEENTLLEADEVKAVCDVLFDDVFSMDEETELCLSVFHDFLYDGGTFEDYGEYGIDLLRLHINTNQRLIDPSCGSGRKLSGMYDALMQAYFKGGGEDSIETIHRRILSNNLFGFTSSARACAVARIVLALKYKEFFMAPNISSFDFISVDSAGDFDWAICDLTFIKQKDRHEEYFNKIGRLTHVCGKMLCFCASDTLYGGKTENFRNRLLSDYSIRKVVDLSENKNKDKPVIFSLEKGAKTDHLFEVYKSGSQNERQLYYPSIDSMSSIMVLQDKLSSVRLNFYNQRSSDHTDRIDLLCPQVLGDHVHFFQGIISGCDKAFVVHDNSLIYSQCISECGVPWIKGKDITDKINFYGQYLLYTNDLNDIDEYPLTKKRLELYKNLLLKRRECIKGVRRWFELQWGRDKEIFLNEKIVFPAKSKKNRFIFDTKGFFFSADMYGMTAVEAQSDPVDLEKLAMLLNSDVYEWYLQTMLKKLNGEMYAYYPDRLKSINIPAPDIIASFRDEEDIRRYFGFDKEKNKTG